MSILKIACWSSLRFVSLLVLALNRRIAIWLQPKFEKEGRCLVSVFQHIKLCCIWSLGSVVLKWGGMECDHWQAEVQAAFLLAPLFYVGFCSFLLLREEHRCFGRVIIYIIISPWNEAWLLCVLIFWQFCCLVLLFWDGDLRRFKMLTNFKGSTK